MQRFGGTTFRSKRLPIPAAREVRISTVNFRPGKKTGSSAATVAAFLEVVDREVPAGTDIILLPEGMTVVDTGQKYADVAEPIPGPGDRETRGGSTL